MTTIKAFFSKLGHFFPIFEKGQERPPLPPPLVTRLVPVEFVVGQLVLHEEIPIKKCKYEDVPWQIYGQSSLQIIFT